MKAILPGVLLLWVLFLLCPCFAAAAGGSIEGKVFSSETNQPIKGAGIEFESAQVRKRAAAALVSTDAGGKFSASLPMGRYRYKVLMPGFAQFSGEVAISSEEPMRLSISLDREAIIQGRIIDRNGSPLPRVTISAGKGLDAVTDGSGAFRISGLGSGGYQLRTLRSPLVFEEPMFLSLDAGQTRELGDLTMRRSSTLTIRLVAGKKASPVERADLYLSGNADSRWGRTDRKGEITFSEMAPGSYTISTFDQRIIDPQFPLEIKEGERRVIKVPANFTPPTLSLENGGELFLPSRPVKLRLRGLWINQANLTLYRVNDDRFRDGSIDSDKPESIPQGFLEREKSLPVDLKRERGTWWKRGEVVLPSLSPGVFLAVAESGKTSTRNLFLVTRLGIVAKASPSGTLFYAVDLIDGKAEQGAEIAVYAAGAGGAAPAFKAVTDAGGLAEYAGGGSSAKIIASKEGNPAFLRLNKSSEEGMGEQLKVYLYTDRPVYRPGQTVYFKGVVRKRVGEGYALPRPEKIRLTILDSREQSVMEREYEISPSGSFNGEIALSGAPALGDYTLQAERGEEKWQAVFSVREYRKPEFQVSLHPSRKFVVGGESCELALKAMYYFGAPVAGAKVQYRIYSQSAYGSFPSQESSPEEDSSLEEDYGGYSDFLGEGEAVTDDAGETVISVPTEATASLSTYTIEADVTDIASRQVSASTRFLVTPSLVALDIRSRTFLTSPGTATEFSVRTGTWEGTGIPAVVSVSVEEQLFDRKSGTTSFRSVEQIKVETGAGGKGQFTYTFPRPGYWRVSGTVFDQQGRKTTTEEWVWVWREGHSWDSSYRELEADLDGKSFKPGATAKLLVRNPSPGSDLLLAVEGREVYGRRLIHGAGAVEVVDIPVVSEYAPYVFLTTTVVANGRFYTRTNTLRVDYQPDKLDVTVKADKEVYAPGDKVRLAVTAAGSKGSSSQGAELSLAVVDEAIYAVSPERVEDIYRFFRGNREHLVMTLNSFPRVFLGGGSKAEAAPAAEDDLKGIKVRKVFKDTSLWIPVLRADGDGRAAAEFVLPDNLTTWRATAVGHTPESEFGSGMQKFISRLDIMARLQPPRFFIQGDELKVPAVINNMTDEQSEVTGRFEAEGLTLLEGSAFSGRIAPRGNLRRDALIRAAAFGDSLLRLRTLAGARGDAMELEVPVLPRAMQREERGNIALRSTAGETVLNFPQKALEEGASLKITLSPTLAGSLNDSLAALVDFPYGCVEQTMSRFLPAVYVRNLLGSGPFTLDPSTAERLPRVLDEGLKRLYDFQHDDGGWGWWKEDPTDPYMTAYVIYGLTLAQKGGVRVDQSSLDRGVEALRELAKKTPVNSLPYVYRSLTLSAQPDPAVERKIESSWNRLHPSEKVYYVDALLHGGEKEKARKYLATLKDQVKREGSAGYLQDEDALSWWYSWRWSGSAVESTAMLLETVLAADPADPLASSLAEFLVRKRSGRWWNTTRGSAAVVKALAEYTAATGESEASYTADLIVNGRKVEKIQVDGGKPAGGKSSLTLSGSELRRGPNNVQLVKSTDAGALYLNAVLEYLVPPEQAAQSPGVSIERKVYRVKAVKDGKDWRLEYLPLQPGEKLAPGDEIEVRLVVENREGMNFVIIEDRLPAGFEVRETRGDLRFAGRQDYWNWYVHSERHDERMAFFLDDLPAGRHEFQYVMYPELEGKMLALPASVWPMYVPSIKSESAPWQVEVRR